MEVTRGRPTPFPLADIVSNMDEVVRPLAGTKYAWMSVDA